MKTFGLYHESGKNQILLYAGKDTQPVMQKTRWKIIPMFLRSIFGVKEEKYPPAILIAGGGTGGHLFPGIAIAESLLEKDKNTRILFVSAGNDFEKAVLSEKGFSLKAIDVQGIKGRGPVAKLKSLFKIPKAIVRSISIIKDFRPCLVMGMGSYSSGPVAIAAWILGVGIVLHEQNLRPGITNRMLSRIADRIYVSFPGTSAILDTDKSRMVGNPVRREILETARALSGNDKHSNHSGGKPMTIVILGGSQGAHSINEAVMEALPYLSRKREYRFIHQTGKADEAVVRETYQRFGISGTVQAFFHDMASLYSEADLLICRAGATTVAEVTSIGKGVIFIPYPFAADNHQVLNAKALVDEGAAEIILEAALSGEKLAETIDTLAGEPERIHVMEKKSRMFGRPDAAEEIIKDVYTLIQGV